jgi:tetratricopeptide (TPR) repeat protein
MTRVKPTYLLILFCLLFALASCTPPAEEAACDPEANHLAAGDAQLEDEEYGRAITAFTCAIEEDPLNVAAYRKRIEASLLSGGYSNALRDYTNINTRVAPNVPDAVDQILAHYQVALAGSPDNIALLTGHSFAQWQAYNMDATLADTAHILEIEPDNLYALTFHGSASFFNGDAETGQRDFARALELAPESADLHFILADGYLYGLGDLEHALEAATTAKELGLDTARVNAIIATVYFNQGDVAAAVPYFAQHIENATQETIAGDSLQAGNSITIHITPGQTYRFPVEVSAGETLAVTTTSPDEVDTIMVLRAADSSLVIGNDDAVDLNAGFEQEIADADTYTLLLSTFEGAGSGQIILSRQ